MIFGRESNHQKKALECNARGVAFSKQKKRREALAEFLRATEFDPQLKPAFGNAALMLFELGEFAAALEYNGDSLKLKKDDATGWCLRGKCYFELSRHSNAIEAFTTAIEFDPKKVDAYRWRAMTYKSLNDQASAIEDFKMCAELEPNYGPWLHNIGYCYCEMGEGEEGYRWLERACAVAPELYPPLSQLAGLAARRGDHRTAIRAYTRLIENFADQRDYVGWLGARAASLEASGDREAAGADRKLLAQKHVEYLNGLKANGGKFVVGALVQANADLYKKGSEDLPCMVVISFDPEISRSPKALLALAHQLGVIKGREFDDPDLALAAAFTTNEMAVENRRRRIPERLAGGRIAYAADLWIRRHLLAQRYLVDPILPCIAEPGDVGRIGLMPFKYLERAVD